MPSIALENLFLIKKIVLTFTLTGVGLDLRKERDRSGSYFVGLKIRDRDDNSPPLITGNTKVVINVNPPSKNTNVINKLCTMVMDKVIDVIDRVMDETVASDECDGCDGIIKKSSNNQARVKSKTERNTKNERILEEKETSNEVLNMPSQVEQSESQSHTEYKVEEVQSAITIGDRVVIDDCPGHWSWASPFTVEAMDGGMAKLEMVEELVEIERLFLA